ncbi:zinc finger protein [Theobroma cacao]|nr:zinc finger protein [Theobroma cacao]
MATNRFICEICNKGFQRDQNLQLHRRGHNLPWKLKQRTNKEVRKKVYICPEKTCVHHDRSRALGDLTGIKKHFSRKHGEKKWKCEKCSKKYAVQSDWKAHSKICGTREYRCDCGTLFSRPDFAGPELVENLNANGQKPRLQLWLDQANSQLNPIGIPSNANAFLATKSTSLPDLGIAPMTISLSSTRATIMKDGSALGDLNSSSFVNNATTKNMDNLNSDEFVLGGNETANESTRKGSLVNGKRGRGGHSTDCVVEETEEEEKWQSLGPPCT